MEIKYTREEVAKHIDNNSLWIILENKVYDVTNFILEHPGGEDVLLQWGGQDATDAYVKHDTISHQENSCFQVLMMLGTRQMREK